MLLVSTWFHEMLCFLVLSGEIDDSIWLNNCTAYPSALEVILPIANQHECVLMIALAMFAEEIPTDKTICLGYKNDVWEHGADKRKSRF